jgi:hypothetical protein
MFACPLFAIMCSGDLLDILHSVSSHSAPVAKVGTLTRWMVYICHLIMYGRPTLPGARSGEMRCEYQNRLRGGSNEVIYTICTLTLVTGVKRRCAGTDTATFGPQKSQVIIRVSTIGSPTVFTNVRQAGMIWQSWYSFC